MISDVETVAPESFATELLVVPLAGAPSALFLRLDALLGGRLARLVESGEATADANRVAVLHVADGEQVAAKRVAVVGVAADGEVDEDSVRTASAAAVGAAKGFGGTVAWAFDPDLALPPDRQVTSVVEGAVLGAYDPARWKTREAPRSSEKIVVVGADAALDAAATRAELVARWTNRARELVDAPPNELTPVGLADAAEALLAPLGVVVETLGPDEIDALGLGALAAVGQGSANEPRLIVLRYAGRAKSGPVLGLIGKGVTFDSGGFFLKPQADIVKQKADMGGAAAVIGAVGAAAELGLPLAILGVIPAAENMLDGAAYRPGDILHTGSGLTVEVTNPDAEGRLIMADALWYARQNGATHLIDVATLTNAVRGAMGDMYAAVFANDDAWRTQIVDAGNASGDHAWAWPLHRRYRRLLDSPLADLRHTSGRNFGYAIIAASFLERFAGDGPWAHVDIFSTAYLDEQRDYFPRGATGAGVRLLTELATRMAAG
jgi:leucyl aminopeptidase